MPEAWNPEDRYEGRGSYFLPPANAIIISLTGFLSEVDSSVIWMQQH